MFMSVFVLFLDLRSFFLIPYSYGSTALLLLLLRMPELEKKETETSYRITGPACLMLSVNVYPYTPSSAYCGPFA